MINPKLKRCFVTGLIGNVMFILFILCCLVYYAVLSGYSFTVELFLYAIEIFGFVLMAISNVYLCRTVQGARILKVLICGYTAVELLMMLLELGIIKPDFYNGMRKSFVIIHVVMSVFIMITFLQLCPENKTHEITVVIACVAVILGVLGYRVYLSMIFNAAAFVFLYSAMLFNLSHEKISIFCKGDKVISREYKSSFFEKN